MSLLPGSKIILIIIIFTAFFSGCAREVKEDTVNYQTYGNSTEYSKISDEKIDSYLTYEVQFTLKEPADCMTVDIESAYLQKTFPMYKEPKKAFFILEKKLKVTPQILKNSALFTPLGRNFNNEWELYTPVRICSGKNDPLSALDVSEYRIRFTTFEKNHFYYIIKISCPSEIIFSSYNPPLKK
jgi:hypothetical protein